MRRCISFKPTGSGVHLIKVLPFEETPEDPGLEAAWILGRALAFLEPLTADLGVALRSLDEPFLDGSAMAAHRNWLIRRQDLDPRRDARPTFQPDCDRMRHVPEINSSAIEQVLAEALAQPAPPERCVTFEVLQVKVARLRLLSEDLAAADTLSVWGRRSEYAVPIVHDDRGAWIDTYPDGLYTPLELQVDNISGTVRAGLIFGWSLWKEEGSAEHAAIVDFARALIARGYEIDQLDDAFRKWLP